MRIAECWWRAMTDAEGAPLATPGRVQRGARYRAHDHSDVRLGPGRQSFVGTSRAVQFGPLGWHVEGIRIKTPAGRRGQAAAATELSGSRNVERSNLRCEMVACPKQPSPPPSTRASRRYQLRDSSPPIFRNPHSGFRISSALLPKLFCQIQCLQIGQMLAAANQLLFQ